MNAAIQRQYKLYKETDTKMQSEIDSLFRGIYNFTYKESRVGLAGVFLSLCKVCFLVHMIVT
jgi:hypothetical protein